MTTNPAPLGSIGEKHTIVEHGLPNCNMQITLFEYPNLIAECAVSVATHNYCYARVQNFEYRDPHHFIYDYQLVIGSNNTKCNI